MTNPIKRGSEVQARFIKVNGVQELEPGGDYQSFHLYTEGFQPGEGLVDDSELGGDRHNLVDPTLPAKGLSNPTGSLSVALDLRQIGYWLTSMWGAPVTTGSGSEFTHVWTSGGTAPQLLGLDLPIANDLPRVVDAMAISSMSIDLADTDGYRQVSMDSIVRSVRSPDDGPYPANVLNAPARAKVAGTQGLMKIDDVQLGNILGGQIQFGNGAFGERYFDGSDHLGAIEIGTPSLSLSPNLRVRADANAVLSTFDGKTPFKVEIVYSAHGLELSLTMPQVLANPVLPAANGPGGMEVSPSFMASQSPTMPMLIATLKNDMAGY